MAVQRHYRAFISYSHSDEAWARWLQRALESYRLPKSLRQSQPHLPARLFPIFRDRDELASGGDLSESIRKAMDDSDALIVVCSPAARVSHWVNEEIRRFRASGRGDRIFCLLVAGNPDPHSPDCAFPAAILQDESGNIIHEPLAADATPGGDGKRNAMLKIAAGLLDVGVDDLKRRDAQRQARFWSIVATGAVFIAVLTIGLAVYALNAKRESEIRRSQAENLIGFMLGDLRERLEPIGKLEILDSIGDQAMNYFATLGDRGTPNELRERGKALHQIGEVRKSKGDLKAALLAFEESLKQMQALHEADPENNDNLFELGQAEFWVGYVAWERGDLKLAEKALKNYMQYSRELLRRDPGNSVYNMELSYAYSNLGSLARARGNTRAALDNFILSRDINAEELKKTPEDIELAYSLAEAWSWIGSSKMDLGDLTGSDEAFAEIAKLLRPIYLKDENARATFTYASNLTFQTDAKLYLGDIDSAKRLNAESLGILSMLTEKDPNNADWQQVLFKAELLRLSMIPRGGWTNGHDAELDGLVVRANALVAKDPSSTKNKILASSMYREKALRKLQNGKTKEAIVSAETSRDLIVGLLEESDKSPLLVAELAKSALILGSAQMADGQAGPAKNTWAETATLLDGQTIRIFDFTPLRRLLAMNLGEAEKAMVMESELSKAAYKDPRYAPEPTTSGTAVPSVPTPNLSKEN
ncbi:MAG: TIR domain-containing protein [Arenimonas sp.]